MRPSRARARSRWLQGRRRQAPGRNHNVRWAPMLGTCDDVTRTSGSVAETANGIVMGRDRCRKMRRAGYQGQPAAFTLSGMDQMVIGSGAPHQCLGGVVAFVPTDRHSVRALGLPLFGNRNRTLRATAFDAASNCQHWDGCLDTMFNANELMRARCCRRVRAREMAACGSCV